MGLVIRACAIRCISCHYEGRSRLQGPGRGAAIVTAVMLGGGILYWPLLLVATPFVLWLVCTPTCHICPRCGWKYPVPLDVYKEQQKLAYLCSCRAGTRSPNHNERAQPHSPAGTGDSIVR